MTTQRIQMCRDLRRHRKEHDVNPFEPKWAGTIFGWQPLPFRVLGDATVTMLQGEVYTLRHPEVLTLAAWGAA